MATDKPHQQTEWYAILSDEEKLKVDEYTDKWPWSRMIEVPYHSFEWKETPEGAQFWLNKSQDFNNPKPSPSMGVNTKPADRIEYKGRLIYFEYGTPESIIEEVKQKLK